MENVPAIRRGSIQPEPDANCGRHEKGQQEVCTPVYVRYDFLKTSFKPLAAAGIVQYAERKRVENEFFNSLSNLGQLYGITLNKGNRFGFPKNILTAYHAAVVKLKEVAPKLQLFIINNARHIATVSTAKTYSTGLSLYYIPVRPLYWMLKEAARKAQGDLVLSAFSYLYRVAKVPYYTDTSSFLYNEYEMIKSCYEQDGCEEDEIFYTQIMEEFEDMQSVGEDLLRQISKGLQLKSWGERLKGFRADRPEDIALAAVSEKMYSLYKQYPKRTIFSSIPEGLFEPGEEERISPCEYLSFFWDGDGHIYHNLMENVNITLQEKSVIDEPVAVQYFNKPQAEEQHNLDFERQFFECLDELCTILNDYYE